MAKVTKTTSKKAKKVSLLDAAIIGATTPSMGKLEGMNNKPKKSKAKEQRDE